MIPLLTSHKALCFDCYGTIIDWETAIYERIQPILAATSTSITRAEALEAFCSVETDIQAQHPSMPYTQLLAHVYVALGQRLGSSESFNLTPDDPTAITFGSSVGDWKPFQDSARALGELSKHFKLVVLSNVDGALFSRTRTLLEGPGGFTFDRVITAQEIGSYKPNLNNFHYMLRDLEDKFGITKEQVLVTAQSQTHDHIPANAIGIDTAWIDREGSYIGHTPLAKYIYRFRTLGEMAHAVEQELATVTGF